MELKLGAGPGSRPALVNVSHILRNTLDLPNENMGVVESNRVKNYSKSVNKILDIDGTNIFEFSSSTNNSTKLSNQENNHSANKAKQTNKQSINIVSFN